MIHPATLTSGMSKPRLLPHPGFRHLDDQVLNMFCYVLRHYGNPGPALVISRDGENVCAQFGDWNGNIVDPHDDSHLLHHQMVLLLENIFHKLVLLMRSVGLPQAEFYFSTDLTLVDVRLAINKFIGPGMLNDVFGKLVKTPEIIKIEIIDNRVMDAIRQGGGTYDGELLLKPSKFREMELPNGSYTPLYAEIKR